MSSVGTDSTQLSVRPAVNADVQAITEMVIRAKQSNGYDATFMAACRQELTVTASDLSVGEHWVCEDESIVAYISWQANRETDCVEVGSLFIDPNWQRQGVGCKLWQKVAQQAQTLGLEHIRLDADPAAVPFYRAMGLTVIAQVPSGSIPGRLLPRMQLTLK